MMDLITILAFVVAASIFIYVALDGFDLGLGILFPLIREPDARDMALNSIAPVWDGNETWLVLGGGALMAVFPPAYAILMPALYMPVMLLLFGLIFRGVAFSFREQHRGNRPVWDWAFFGGSLAAALAQGLSIGTVLQGVQVADGVYAGGNWAWITPFTLLTAVATVIGYALLGAAWLIFKSEGPLRDRAYDLARPLCFIMLAAIAAVSAVTPFLSHDYWLNWFSWPRILLAAPVPVATVVIAVALLRVLATRRDHWPFPLVLMLFGLCFAGLGISIYPEVVPGVLTISEAAAPEATLKLMAWGVAILLPITIGYTAFSYWVFRGKTDASSGYH